MIHTSHYAYCVVCSIQHPIQHLIQHLLCFSHSFRFAKKKTVSDSKPRKNNQKTFAMASTNVRDAVLSMIPSLSLIPSEVAEWLLGYSLLSSLPMCFILIIILIIIIIMGAYPILSAIPPTRSI